MVSGEYLNYGFLAYINGLLVSGLSPAEIFMEESYEQLFHQSESTNKFLRMKLKTQR